MVWNSYKEKNFLYVCPFLHGLNSAKRSRTFCIHQRIGISRTPLATNRVEHYYWYRDVVELFLILHLIKKMGRKPVNGQIHFIRKLPTMKLHLWVNNWRKVSLLNKTKSWPKESENIFRKSNQPHHTLKAWRNNNWGLNYYEISL